MLKRLFLFLMFLNFEGCAKPKETDKIPDKYHDARLQFYLDEFVADAQKNGVTVSADMIDSLRVMKFVSDVDQEKLARGQTVSGDSGTIGTCASFSEQKSMDAGFKTFYSKANSWSEVWIDDELDSKDSHPMALKELIYHELGHCLLAFEHVEPKPHSIMSPEMSLNGKWLTKNWDNLITDFFGLAKK
jgi:hypothetical protein